MNTSLYLGADRIVMTHDRNADLLYAEAVQRIQEGVPEAPVREVLEGYGRESGGKRNLDLAYRAMQALPAASDWPYEEPSELSSILASATQLPGVRDPVSDLGERLMGAWAGRAVGCVMGKPLEDMAAGEVREYLQAHEAWPLSGYVPPPAGQGRQWRLHESWQGAVSGAFTVTPRDDDLDYSVLNLCIVEIAGPDPSPACVGRAWLDHLVYGLTYTAERQAYRNLVDGVKPPESSVIFNPYREWIGAQIRGDVWGYVSPGDPVLAASRAWTDACVSHRANGIYGEMFVAAVLASVLGGAELRVALEEGLGCLPGRSRYAEVVRTVLGWWDTDRSSQFPQERIEMTFGQYHHVHVLKNTAVMIAGLLWGGETFLGGVETVISGGWDTDSNGATAGSILGALLGVEGIPPELMQPLGGRLETYVRGEPNPSLIDLVNRTRRAATPR